MKLMGILNVTPDSFSDGGRFTTVEAAVLQGERLHAEGADWLDVGGESTRPGARSPDVGEELRRVIPVVERLAATGAPISVDTRRAVVAEAAIAAGATLVNDVSGGADPEMFAVVARNGVGMVLMHMRGTPETMQADTTYRDVVAEVWAWLEARFEAACRAGVAAEKILLDPGIGFGKDGAQNLRLLADLPARTWRPVLLGASRKSFIGALTGQPRPEERLEGSLAVALHAAASGVAVCRVHDVLATRRALSVWTAIRREG